MKKLVLTLLLTSSVTWANGEQLVQSNGCMDCHNIIGKKLAPAFAGIGRKNIQWYGTDAKSKIMESIKNGSKGKYRQFSDSEMPAYGHLSSVELESIANWILEEYEKNKQLMKR